jgi:hypothetical protein
MNPSAINIINRAADLAGTYGNVKTTPERVDAINDARGRCELIRQSLELFIRYCYQPYNLRTNMIPAGVWTPFGSAGKPRKSKDKDTRPELTKDERTVVRVWLQQLKQHRRFPLFVYSAESRRWHVDKLRYDNEAAALAWLENNTIDAKTYVTIRHQLHQ